MRLLLARHGNTFEKGQTPFYVGARTDLDLTAAGREQAAALAAALKAGGLRPDRVVCGPLKRTRQHAAVVCEALGLPPAAVDPALTELDYGAWEGKTNDEVDALSGGPAVREAWDRRRQRPASAGFSPSEAEVDAGLDRLLAGLGAGVGGGLALLVSSNGLLGSFLKTVPGAYEKALAEGALKTAPGSCGGLRLEGARRQVLFWNKKPAELPVALLA